MLDTCSKRNLSFEGPYQLYIKKKRMESGGKGYEFLPVFYVETPDKKFHGVLDVNMIDYRKYKSGQLYCRGGILINSKKDCYYMTRYDQEKTAIKKESRKSGCYLACFIFILLMLISTCVEFVLPLFC